MPDPRLRLRRPGPASAASAGGALLPGPCLARRPAPHRLVLARVHPAEGSVRPGPDPGLYRAMVTLSGLAILVLAALIASGIIR